MTKVSQGWSYINSSWLVWIQGRSQTTAFGHSSTTNFRFHALDSMSSTSSSPEPVQRIKTKKKDSKKKTKSSTAVVPEHGKDEGTNPDWDYVPPEGTILLDHNVDSAEFDWDTVKNDEDVELWLVRVPEGVSVLFK